MSLSSINLTDRYLVPRYYYYNRDGVKGIDLSKFKDLKIIPVIFKELLKVCQAIIQALAKFLMATPAYGGIAATSALIEVAKSILSYSYYARILLNKIGYKMKYEDVFRVDKLKKDIDDLSKMQSQIGKYSQDMVKWVFDDLLNELKIENEFIRQLIYIIGSILLMSGSNKLKLNVADAAKKEFKKDMALRFKDSILKYKGHIRAGKILLFFGQRAFDMYKMYRAIEDNYEKTAEEQEKIFSSDELLAKSDQKVFKKRSVRMKQIAETMKSMPDDHPQKELLARQYAELVAQDDADSQKIVDVIDKMVAA